MEVVEDGLRLSRRGISRRENAVDRPDVRVLEVVVDRHPSIDMRETLARSPHVCRIAAYKPDDPISRSALK